MRTFTAICERPAASGGFHPCWMTIEADSIEEAIEHFFDSKQANTELSDWELTEIRAASH